MKLARVEQAFDGSKLIFYFTADGRVDFRELVRELAAEFRTRIEMRQIGVRDEAKMLRRLRHLRPAALLHDVPADVRAGVDQDGQAAGPEPQSVEAVRPVRPAEVLPALRAAERARACSTAAAAAKAAATIRRAADPAADAGRTADCGSCGLKLQCTRVDMKPRVAITVGDPAGIGPEIAARAAADPRVLAVCEPVVYGPPAGATFAPGVLSAAAGRAAYDVIVRAVDDAQRGRRARRSRRRRSTRKRSGWPGCRGAATPICSRT